MPNHVTHRMTIKGPTADVAACIERHIPTDPVNKSRDLDFNTVVPMPEIIKGTESSSTVEYGVWVLTGEYKYGSPLGTLFAEKFGIHSREDMRSYLDNNYEGAMAKAERAVQAMAETGHANWYDWSLANWGTKWGAYRTEIVEEAGARAVVKFETAWSVPEPVLLALSALWPSLEFRVVAFDDGWGFAYDAVIRKGEVVRGGRTEATPALYELVYGKAYEPDDEDEDGQD